MKKLISINKQKSQHWVGNGFPVRNMFGYNDLGKTISPFLLLDYAGPHEFPPSQESRGVGEHPHRGFETVTIVYSGDVDHRDSAGNSGSIGPGDVQWMTAASGILHEEMHGKNFQRTGGRFELVQLWINLPAKDKTQAPAYQTLREKEIPVVPLSDNSGTVRVIAGEIHGHEGPAKTHTPINLWDIRLGPGGTATFQVPEGHTAVVFVLTGSVKLCGENLVSEAEIAVLDNSNNEFSLSALAESKVLFLGGAPINEPVVGLGPFVMNTSAEITKAFQDYDDGLFGTLPKPK